MIVVTSLLRMLLFILELVARVINDSDGKCEDLGEAVGSVLMLVYTLVMEVVPISVLLLLFKFKFNARRLGRLGVMLRQQQYEHDNAHAERNRMMLSSVLLPQFAERRLRRGN